MEIKEVIPEMIKKIGSKNSKIQQEELSQAMTWNQSFTSQQEAVSKCLKSCPGPEECPVAGVLYFQPTDDIYGPYSFKCPRYAKWKKQVELEKKVMESIPKKFWDKTFDNYVPLSNDTRNALSVCKKYSQFQAWKTGSNLILLGAYGTGKTHLAAAIIRSAISKGNNAVLVTAPSLASGTIDDIRERFKCIRDVDLIAIDDFSNESEHKLIAQEIFELINYRYEAEKGLVMTSNLSPNELKESLGDRVFDRVLERTLILHVKDVGSYRKNKREKYLEWVD